MTETDVEKYLRKYLIFAGWKILGKRKKKGEHGVDIYASHPLQRRTLWVEAKGGSGKNPHQEVHNGFYVLLGQCLSRMDIEGNHPNKSRIYAIAIPYSWAVVFRKKIAKMKYGWNLLRLYVYLVKKNGDVDKKTYKSFLK